MNRMTRRFLTVGALLIFVLGLAGTPVLAQLETGRLMGTVHDPSGAVVAHAQISARHVATGTESQTVTNDDGIYVFPSQRIGDYEVSVAAPGFATAVQKNVRVISSVTT